MFSEKLIMRWIADFAKISAILLQECRATE
jgi:hypothetical protein